MRLLWGGDQGGRGDPEPILAVAVAADGQVLRGTADAPPTILDRLSQREAPSLATDRGQPPQPLVDAVHTWGVPVVLTGGPSYLVEADHAVVCDVDITTSSDERPLALLARRPEAWWEVDEWAELLAGRFGPWAIAMRNEQVVSLCHSSRAGLGAAEAGVWTHPDHRGHGYATAVTAAWAAVARPCFDALFYSTALDNEASQAVAGHLGARPVGSIWQVRPAP